MLAVRVTRWFCRCRHLRWRDQRRIGDAVELVPSHCPCGRAAAARYCSAASTSWGSVWRMCRCRSEVSEVFDSSMMIRSPARYRDGMLWYRLRCRRSGWPSCLRRGCVCIFSSPPLAILLMNARRRQRIGTPLLVYGTRRCPPSHVAVVMVTPMAMHRHNVANCGYSLRSNMWPSASQSLKTKQQFAKTMQRPFAVRVTPSMHSRRGNRRWMPFKCASPIS